MIKLKSRDEVILDYTLSLMTIVLIGDEWRNAATVQEHPEPGDQSKEAASRL